MEKLKIIFTPRCKSKHPPINKTQTNKLGLQQMIVFISITLTTVVLIVQFCLCQLVVKNVIDVIDIYYHPVISTCGHRRHCKVYLLHPLKSICKNPSQSNSEDIHQDNNQYMTVFISFYFQVAPVWTVMLLSLCRGRCKI